MSRVKDIVKEMTPFERAISMVQLEYNKAVSKHPVFPKSMDGGQCIIVEEYLEFSQALNDYKKNYSQKDKEHLIEEAAQTVVVFLRFLEERLK